MDTQKMEKQNKFRNSISLKLIIVVILSLLLLIPSFMVRQLIDERESRKNETIKEITEKWGTNQVINGPILIVPYLKREYRNKKDYSDNIHYFHILPSELAIEGTLSPTLRYRGIYKVITYNSLLNLKGSFKAEDIKNWPDQYNQILWQDARIVLGINDLKGVTENVVIEWEKEEYKFSPGNFHCSMFETGINSKIKLSPNTNYKFDLKLSLNGSEAIYFVPTGSSTFVNLKSDWNTPSFDGSFLPNERKVDENGFNANWKVIEMNRNFPQNWSDDAYGIYSDLQQFGVKLLMPVDTYQKSTRSVKYAFLFIALTFLIVFFSEITGKNRVHPVQYLIIGIGLVIFYSLLIALAEHVSFNTAYLMSSFVIVFMTTSYIKALLKKWKPTIVISGFLVILYLFLFTILQIADYALLLGNIGLVLILGLVMFYSKKVDWYGSRTDKKELSQLDNN